MNGVEGMLYMFSQATSDGALTLTITFALGTDLDNAQVQVQNRVAQTLPRLPQDVQRIGVTTEKASPDFIMVVAPRLARRALRHALPVELRAPAGEGRAHAACRASARRRCSAPANTACASGSIRTAWPSRQLTASDVVRAIREQNVQVAAGVLGAPPAPSDATFQLSINTQGRLTTEDEFGDIVVRATDDGQITRLSDVGAPRARLEPLLAAQPARQQAGGRHRRLPAPRHQRAPGLDDVHATMERLKAELPAGRGLPHRLRPDDLRARVDRRRGRTRCSRPSCWSSSSWWCSCRRGARRSSRWSPCRCR